MRLERILNCFTLRPNYYYKNLKFIALSNPYDPKLYTLIAQGDTQAFARAHALFKTPLVYFAKRSIDNMGEVEDIISDAFLLLWQSREKFESDSHLRNFLFITVRHKILNYHNARLRHGKILEKVYSGLDDVENADPDTVQTEMIGLIHQAVKSLPEDYRKIFDLSYSHDLSPKEIGEKLGMNASTVRNSKDEGYRVNKKNTERKVNAGMGSGLLHRLVTAIPEKKISFPGRNASFVCINYM